MTKPITSHTAKRIQVPSGNENIITRQVMIPRIGTKGTHGVLNGLGKFGSRLRKTITPTQTRTKASNVPMLVISPTTLAGTNAANALTKSMNNKLLFAGV